MKINTGIHRTSKVLASGTRRYYYYSSRFSDRRLFWTSDGAPAKQSQEFIAAYKEAIALTRGGAHGTLRRAVADYLKTINGLSASTQETYRIHAGYVIEKFGDVPLRYFEDKRIRRKIISWRDSMSRTPRKADNCVSALSRVLAHAVDNGDVSFNRAENIKNIYKAKTGEPIWSKSQISDYVSDASPYLKWHLLLKRYTGLRRKDIVALPLSADKGTHFEYKTSKTGKTVIIPILPDCRSLLTEILAYRTVHDVSCLTVLFNSRHKPWTRDGINASSRKQRIKHNIKVREHRLRGNFVTSLCIAGFRDTEIANIVGWSVDRVMDMRRIYTDQNDIITAQIKRLSEHPL